MKGGKVNKTVYVCQACGQTSSKWLGRCTGCGAWNSLAEETISPVKDKGRGVVSEKSIPLPLSDISLSELSDRISVGMNEMDRVFGGGLVSGGVVLVAGEPGIGKSTLLLQILNNLSRKDKKVLYVSGEESLNQIRLRAERLGPLSENLWILSEMDMDEIERHVNQVSPDILAVDSIQTLSCMEFSSSPGTVAQVRESALRLIQIAKSRGIPTIIVGHITKEGAIAGPKLLEHLVDTVIHFEGDRSHGLRIVRAVKNRYGPTHEIGVFEMTGSGLSEVANPSQVFLEERPKNSPGSVIFPALEGTRPILVEVQALVSASHLAMPRRTSTGVDTNRLAMLIAVAERHLGITLFDRDIFVNIVGGFKINEPAADLAIIIALISSLRNIPVANEFAVFGEIGLTGEVRKVSRTELRINEAARLGLSKCLLPKAGIEKIKIPDRLSIIPVEKMEDGVRELFHLS